MKILTLCYEFPPIGGGGGRVAEKVALALADRGHEVQVQTAGMPHLAREETLGKMRIHRNPSFRRREDTCSVLEMGLYLITNFLPTLQFVRRWQPDVLHVHFAVPTGVLAWALHHLRGIPYVLTIHLGDVPGGVPEQTASLFRTLKPLTNPIWEQAAEITAVSHFVADLAREAYGRIPLVIHNGMPPLPKIWEPEVGEELRLLFIGRLSVQKNPLLAIEAVAAMVQKNWNLKIVGEGPLGGTMRNRVAQLGLEQQVCFLGWRSTHEVAEVLSHSDVLLMPSLQEGLPMAGIEALHYGLSIVGSTIGGLQDLVSDSVNGFLCPFSAKDFACRLDSLAASSSLLLAQKQASREKAKDFEFETSVEMYEKILRTAADVPYS